MSQWEWDDAVANIFPDLNVLVHSYIVFDDAAKENFKVNFL